MGQEINLFLLQDSQLSMLQDRWIGLILALSSSGCIGCSFVLTKKGLNAASGGGVSHNGVDSSFISRAAGNHSYLKNTLWWSGMVLSMCCLCMALVLTCVRA